MVPALEENVQEVERIPGQYSQEELEGYFLLIDEAPHKYERHLIRRECFEVISRESNS